MSDRVEPMGEAAATAAANAELRAEVLRLNKVLRALMDRAERASSGSGSGFGLTQATVILEAQVRDRTRQLEEALRENERMTDDLRLEREEQRRLIKSLEETRQQLVQSEKLASIGQLAAGVAHEINNPIAFVASNLAVLGKYASSLLGLVEGIEGLALGAEESRRLGELERDLELPRLREDLPALIDESIHGVDRVRKIVQDLRDFSRVGEESWQAVDLVAGVESALNLVGGELRLKAELRREYGPMPLVECVPSQINQAFLSLLLNAAESIRGRGTIAVRSGCEGDAAWIAVSDTGVGIPEGDLPRIFDPFFTTKPVGQGPGLGLSVAYGIMKAHGGRIEVESEVGVGSTFTLRLPVHRKNAG